VLLQNGVNLSARKTTGVSDSVGAPITNRTESSHAPQGPRILQIASASWFISAHSPLADQTVFRRYNPGRIRRPSAGRLRDDAGCNRSPGLSSRVKHLPTEGIHQFSSAVPAICRIIIDRLALSHAETQLRFVNNLIAYIVSEAWINRRI